MKNQRQKRITAGKLTEQLQNDPAYVSRMQELERQHKQRVADHRAAAAPIVDDLARAGFHCTSIDDLRRNTPRYVDAIPVLLRWLAAVPQADVKESIVRALSVPWAKPAAAGPLIAEFRRAASDGLRWAIGNALSIVADESVSSDVIDLARDKKYGKSREMVALALGNMKNPRAVDALIELLTDKQVAGHAAMAVRKLRAARAEPHLKELLHDDRSWVRNEAKKALRAIAK